MANKRERKKTKKWVSVLLVAGIGIDLLLVGYVLYLLWDRAFGPTETTLAAPAAQVQIELWDAYEQAQAAALAQAKDAQLVSASTQWQAVSEQTLVDGAANWSFVFYSSASSHVLDVVVSAEKAQVVKQTQVWDAPHPLTGEAWQTGPREALLVFLAYDGRTFLAKHPQATVDLHLASSAEDQNGGEALWTVVAIDPQGQSMSLAQIDTETRQVLSN